MLWPEPEPGERSEAKLPGTGTGGAVELPVMGLGGAGSLGPSTYLQKRGWQHGRDLLLGYMHPVGFHASN